MITRPQPQKTALQSAVDRKNIRKVKDILSHSKNHWMLIKPNVNGDLPLDMCVRYGNVNILKVLLDAHANTNFKYTIKNKQKFSPLHTAIRQYIRILNHSKRNFLNDYTATTPSKDFPKVIELLLEYFPEFLNCEEYRGLPPIFFAFTGMHNIISGQDEIRNSYTCRRKLAKIAELLIKSGAKLDNFKGGSPRAYAKNKKLLPLVEKWKMEAKKEKEINYPQVEEKSKKTQTQKKHDGRKEKREEKRSSAEIKKFTSSLHPMLPIKISSSNDIEKIILTNKERKIVNVLGKMITPLYQTRLRKNHEEKLSSMTPQKKKNIHGKLISFNEAKIANIINQFVFETEAAESSRISAENRAAIARQLNSFFNGKPIKKSDEKKAHTLIKNYLRAGSLVHKKVGFFCCKRNQVEIVPNKKALVQFGTSIAELFCRPQP